jgi:hypothetical protein
MGIGGIYDDGIWIEKQHFFLPFQNLIYPAHSCTLFLVPGKAAHDALSPGFGRM